MKRILLLLSVCLSVSSCNFIDRYFRQDVVARVGKDLLYRSDIQDLNIHGLSEVDSSRVVNQYIYSWAKDRLLIDMAETQLSKNDKNVEKQLEDYRRQLLVYRYEKQYVAQRLDTTITEDEYRDFYDRHPDNLRTGHSLMKGIVIKVKNDSPNMSLIRRLYKSRKSEDLDRLNEICYTSAERYQIYENWVSSEVIAEELDEDVEYCERAFSSSSYLERKTKTYTYFVTLDDKIRKGAVAPFEYSRQVIRDIILSKRKQELLSTLEKDLLNDAVGSNRLVIYTK